MTIYDVHVTLSYVVPISLHSLGFFLLLRTPTQELGYSQKLYFINLSLAEWLACFFGIVKRISPDGFHHLMLMQYTVGLGMMYMVMVTLTLDRFFRVYLNIKFTLYWSDSCSTKLVSCLWVLQLTLLSIYYLMEVTADNLNTYLFVVYDFMFLFVAIMTYSYIFIKIKKNRRVISKVTEAVTARTEPHVQQDQTRDRSSPRIVTNSREFLSIFVLVITFQTFQAIPDWVFFYHGIKGVQTVTWEYTLLIMMYSTSYISDFFIYTFGLKPVRQTFRRLFKLS